MSLVRRPTAPDAGAPPLRGGLLLAASSDASFIEWDGVAGGQLQGPDEEAAARGISGPGFHPISMSLACKLQPEPQQLLQLLYPVPTHAANRPTIQRWDNPTRTSQNQSRKKKHGRTIAALAPHPARPTPHLPLRRCSVVGPPDAAQIRPARLRRRRDGAAQLLLPAWHSDVYKTTITVSDGDAITSSYQKLWRSLKPLADNGLARFHTHFPCPWQFFGEPRNYLARWDWLKSQRQELKELAERMVMGDRYEELYANDREEPTQSFWTWTHHAQN